MPTGAADADAPDRGPIAVRGWKVFGPGHHKGEYYPPERCAQVPRNFADLKGVVTPVGKLGHDRQQRLLRSLGWPNVGQVTRCDPLPGEYFSIDLDGMPLDVAEVVNAGWLNSGSVEFKERMPDPRDPAKAIPGDVLTGVALLGEEQPALPGMAIPKARYADGTEVPPATRMPEWLLAMFEVARQGGPDPEAAPDHDKSIAFSDMFQEPPPVNADQIIAALAALTPEDKAKVAAACAPAAVMAADPPPAPKPAPKPDATMSDAPPAGDAAPAWFAAAMKPFADGVADLTKRVGAVEADKTAQMSAAAEEKEKAFSAECARVAELAVERGHVPPYLKGAVIAQGKAIGATKTFSDGPHKGKTEFSIWADNLTAGNVTAFSDAIPDAPPAAGPLDARARAVLGLTPLGRTVRDTLTAKGN